MGCAVSDAKKKMESLLGSYRREKSREKKSQRKTERLAVMMKLKMFPFLTKALLHRKKILMKTM